MYPRLSIKDCILKEHLTPPVVGSKNHKLVVENGTGITPEKAKITGEFIQYCCKLLGIKIPCKVFLVAEREKYDMATLAYFNTGNNDIYVYAKNRLLADILRSLAHEIRHMKQNLDHVLTAGSGKTGSIHENEANSFSGIVLRYAAKKWPNIFD